MSLLDKSASKAQLIDILRSMKHPVMGAGGGFAPIGTINFFDASVAPQGWLACDGTTYNITDYPDLATYYASVHGASNFYGGNGTTTFAVPDLRGEFLRGAGTNRHANQGDGANVGVHQDATEMPSTSFSGTSGATIFYGNNLPGSDPLVNPDSIMATTDYNKHSGELHLNEPNSSGSYTSRPTNTSFLICVKATVSGDANAHQYSTDEQIVGKWIDGKDLYEKTIILEGSYRSSMDNIASLPSEAIPHFISGMGIVSGGYTPIHNVNPQYLSEAGLGVWINSSKQINLRAGTDTISRLEITIRYTKTS
jgi:microcystin-dependent protein